MITPDSRASSDTGGDRVLVGVCGGIACNYATKLKYFLRCDDALDIFAVHAVGGLVGNILTAFFAA